MSLGIANIAGSVGRPLLLDASSILKETGEASGKPVQSTGQEPVPAARAEKTERRDAVQATPTTATAVHIDLVTDDTVSGELPEYPVFGPDKFARVAAERSQEAAKADAEAKVEAEAVETPDMAATKAAETVQVEQDVDVSGDAPEAEASGDADDVAEENADLQQDTESA